MVKEYSQLDLDNFEKIKILQKKDSAPIKDKPYRHDTKLLDKGIKQTEDQRYKQKDKNQFSLIENNLATSQISEESKYFFSQNGVDDASGDRKSVV